MELINKAAVVAEIEKLKGKVDDGSSYCNGWQHALRMLEIELNTLEVKEVDLDREIRRYRMRNPIIQHREESLYDYMANVAKHSFELGMAASNKAQKVE